MFGTNASTLHWIFVTSAYLTSLNSGDTYIYATFGKTARDSIVTDLPCHFGKPQMQVSFKNVRDVLRKTEGSTRFFICRKYKKNELNFLFSSRTFLKETCILGFPKWLCSSVTILSLAVFPDVAYIYVSPEFNGWV